MNYFRQVRPFRRAIPLITSSTKALRASNAIEVFDDISLVVEDNTGSSSLSEFARRYEDGWFENYKSKEETTVAGRSAIRYSDIGSLPGHSPMVAVFIDGGSRVFIFSIGHHESPESLPLVRVFDQIISTFEIR